MGCKLSRKFPNFLDAYLEYSNDGFVPEIFNVWSCLSIIAGALERRVWLPWGDTYSFYPNIYVLLVTYPGTGKSVSSGKAVRLLTEVNRQTQRLNILPNQITEAKFIEMMGNGRSFQCGKLSVFQNAAYYYASEASASLRNIFGDFIACLTEFYDCPARFERATKKDGRPISLENVCMNMLGCCTYDYLGKLINEESISGGFASRLIYVCNKDFTVQEQEFQNGFDGADKSKAFKALESDLLADLSDMTNPSGCFIAEDAFKRRWKEWYHPFEVARRSHVSDRIKSLHARTNTNLLKVTMLLSMCESSDLVLKEHHFEMGLKLVMNAQDGIVDILRESHANPNSKSADSVLNFIMKELKRKPGITMEQVKVNATIRGFTDRRKLDNVMNSMLDDGMIVRDSVSPSGTVLKVLGNSDDYF